MSTWFKLEMWCNPQITPVEVVKETTEFVTYTVKDWQGTVSTRRQRKAGEFFSTFEDARDYAVLLAERKLVSAQAEVSRAHNKLKLAKELVRPIEATHAD